MRGGILADDMGLGKTLSILSLILTNFHDKRPLARPQHGFKRHFDKNVTRYLPRTPADKQVQDNNSAKCFSDLYVLYLAELA